MKNLILIFALLSTIFTTKMVDKTRFMYRDTVLSILGKKCYGCHSEIKQKGDLRLDSEAFIRQGSESGSILTAGNPEKSQMYAALVLPEGDDDHMPPSGKPQLTPQEIATI
jgi:hypothetical protein